MSDSPIGAWAGPLEYDTSHGTEAPSSSYGGFREPGHPM